jgi:hypothetical protein
MGGLNATKTREKGTKRQNHGGTEETPEMRNFPIFMVLYYLTMCETAVVWRAASVKQTFTVKFYGG